MIFDDWFALNPSGELNEGQRKAGDEFVAAHHAHRWAELGRVGFNGVAFQLTRGDADTP
jgi:hypothetical protein